MRRDGWTLRQEYVRCGKVTCRSCPHGPYWYGYQREGTRLKKRYIGKELPAPTQPFDRDARLDAIFARATATADLACEILGLQVWPVPKPALNRRYKELMLLHHPDRGGDLRTCQRIVASYTYLRSLR